MSGVVNGLLADLLKADERIDALERQHDELLSKLEAAVEEANAINRHDSATVAQTLGELTGKIQAIIWAAKGGANV